MPRLRALAVLLLAAAVVYLPAALRAELLNFDDPFFFGPRSAFLEGGLAVALDPRATIADAYLPVAHASLWVDWALGGSELPAIPRLHSLLLHVLVAFLLARLLGRLGLGAAAATGAAAVFLLHPALVESVAWASSRKDLLSGLGVVACLSASVDWFRTPSRRRFLAAVGWALFALYSKATAVVLAPLAVLLAWVAVPARTEGPRLRRWPLLCALGALCAAAGLHHAAVAARAGTLGGGVDAGVAERAPGVPGAFAHYLATIAWPSGLNVLYPEVLTLQAFAERAVAGCIVLAAVGAAAAFALTRPRWRLCGVGLCATLLALLPFNTALPASSIAAADRYLYLALPWAALALAAAAGPAAPIACAALAVVLAFPALGRVCAFANSVALWEASLAVDPRNAVACLNLAQAQGDRARMRELVEQAATWARYPQHVLRAEDALATLCWQDERRQRAVRHVQRALEAARALGDGPAARYERVRLALRGAMMAQATGERDLADELAADALQLAPDHAQVLAYRAASLLHQACGADGTLRPDTDAAFAEARTLLDRAFAADSAAADPHVVLGQWHAARGERLLAVKAFDDALARDPANAEAHLAKVDLLLGQSLFTAAEAAARRAIASGSSDASMLSRLGMALAGQNRLDDARSYYEAYLAIRPNDGHVRRLLAATLALALRPLLFQLPPEQLEPRAERIRELDPEHPAGALALAVARRHQRRLPEALVLLEGVAAALPDDPDVRRLHAETHRDL
ncbi:MAG TPA: tetratricopeptide repeat protein, partial [Planctomycetota bacterium]|nr:tetratricopeptide repeat protein [Planctomycetota bacterium]